MRTEAGSLLMKCDCPLWLRKERVLVSCGKCVYCRTVKAHKRAGRMVLEGLLHPVSSFVTLTYSDEHYPADGSVVKEDVRLFLERLSYASGVSCIRYQACGEYGDRTWRGHYHGILFGWPAVPSVALYPVEWAFKTVEKAWGKGIVSVSPFDKQSDYMMKHQVKAMRHAEDDRLQGFAPEFAMQSLRPGLGSGFVPVIVDWYRRWFPDALDVVPVFQYSNADRSKMVLLDDYMLRKLRLELFGRETAHPAFADRRRELYEAMLVVAHGSKALPDFIRRYSEPLRLHMDWRRVEKERRRSLKEL